MHIMPRSMMFHNRFILMRIAACFVFGILLFWGGRIPAYAAQTNATASSSPLAQTQAQLQELFKIQDDTSLPAEERELKEISLRREILKNIITIARTQAQDAYDQLNGVSFDEKDLWKPIQTSILSEITTAQSYYQDIADRLANDSTLTIDDLKNIAKELDQKKSDSIDPAIKKANTISALFHIGALLDVARDRLDKISVDVDKIYSQKLTADPTIRALFDKASNLFKDARASYNNTKDILAHLYDTDTASAHAYAISLYNNLINQKTAAAIPLIVTTTPSTTPNTASSKTVSLQQSMIDKYIQKSLADIVASIKGTYSVFLQMSAQVKEYLK